MMRWQANQSPVFLLMLGNNDPLFDSRRVRTLRKNPGNGSGPHSNPGLRPGPAGTRASRHARICVALAASTLFSFIAVNADDDLASAFDSSTIIIAASENACYRFDIYLATSREQQLRGLMHVRHLPEFTGMLFAYSSPDMRSMWMKNTYLSLDILFLREDGTISNIAANTEPLSLKPIGSTEPVTYVLELNAGVSAKLHIDTDSLIHLRAREGISDDK